MGKQIGPEERKVCTITGLPAVYSFLDSSYNCIYICQPIYDGAVKLHDQYKFPDKEFSFQDAIDSTISNVLYQAEKDRGLVKGKEKEALKQFKKPSKITEIAKKIGINL